MKTKFYSVARVLVIPIAKVAFNLHYHGVENEPRNEEGPYILICNHISNPDPVFLCVGLKQQQPYFMAKKELFKVPVLGALVKALGAYPVNRSGADVSAIKNTIATLNSGRCIGIFPQGHREPGKTPMEANLKTGAAMIASKTNATILPCCIKTKDNKFKIFRRTDVYFGKPIKFEEFNYDPEASGEYLRITNEMFDKVCELYKGAVAEEEAKRAVRKK
jgi:1-acyl-sn-glycerol-3-phosphate acyltransferase